MHLQIAGVYPPSLPNLSAKPDILLPPKLATRHSPPPSSTIPARHSGGSMSFGQRLQEIRDGFERPFWVANLTELFERLSYYAAFASLARYLHETLAFPTERAADLAGLFGGLVWFLAIFGGAVADRLGFRRALSLAYL